MSKGTLIKYIYLHELEDGLSDTIRFLKNIKRENKKEYRDMYLEFEEETENFGNKEPAVYKLWGIKK